MEFAKLLLVQVVMVVAASARPQVLGQDAFQQTLQQQQQPFQPFQQLQQQQGRTASGFQQQQQQPAVQEGVQSFQLINTRSQNPASSQTGQPTRTFGAANNNFQQQGAFRSSAPLRASGSATGFAPAPAPVELANAVPAPVQQHDAQVFQRRPQHAAPTQTIAKASADFGRVQEPARFQQTNSQQFQNPQQFQQDTSRFVQHQPQQQDLAPPQFDQQVPIQFDQGQQDFTSFNQDSVVRAPAAPTAPQVTRTRAQTRRPAVQRPVPAAPAAPAAPAGLRSNPIRVTSDAGQVSNSEEDALFNEQAQNAHYTFSSAVDDKLTDNSQVRQETRDGLNLAGLYSYSDGYFRRTVHYEADENGYRVTKEEVEPIGDGPRPDPNGAADVQAQISGTDYSYRITSDDIKERKKEDAVLATPVQQQRFRQDDRFSS